MMTHLTPQIQHRLASEQNIWLATVRPALTPHLVPTWFLWLEDRIYVCTEEKSVKARNILRHPKVALALENGTSPVICEGTALALALPGPEGVRQGFLQKYEWDITTDDQYNWLVEITPEKWLFW